jgi:hypothetical protein
LLRFWAWRVRFKFITGSPQTNSCRDKILYLRRKGAAGHLYSGGNVDKPHCWVKCPRAIILGKRNKDLDCPFRKKLLHVGVNLPWKIRVHENAI